MPDEEGPLAPGGTGASWNEPDLDEELAEAEDEDHEARDDDGEQDKSRD